MITAELRGGNRPSLNEALGWIGSKVDDIYGASVGRLEDVWIDPGTGAPKWLLVKEGRFGGRTTLIPFEDATAGAGHVWIPYERDVVREAPAVAPGAPLTQSVESTLRSHYTANKPASPTHRGRGHAPAAAPAAAAPPPPAPQPPAYREQAPQYQLADDQQSQHQYDPHQPLPPVPPSPPPVPPGRPSRSGHEGPATPARPQYVPQAQHQYRPPQALPGHSAAQAAPPARYAPPAPRPPQPGPPPGRAARQAPQPPPTYAPPPPAPHGQPPHYAYGPPQPRPDSLAPARRPRGCRPQPPRHAAPAPPPPSAHAGDDPPVAIPIIHALDQPYRIEVQLEGELRISGELKGFSIKPSRPDPAAPEPGQ